MTAVGTYEHTPPFFCEACQMPFGMGKQVELADGTKMPVCELCWNQIPVGQKIKLASDFKHQRTISEAVTAAAAGWLSLLQNVLDYIEQHEVQPGQGGPGGNGEYYHDYEPGPVDPWAEETGGDDGFWMN